MKYIGYLLKSYPLTCLVVAVIWVLCLFTPPRTPLDGVAFIDKWTHLVMYGGLCSVMWVEYMRGHRRPCFRRLVVMALVLPVAMGGLLELLQATCTGGRRSGDWLDFAANTLGVAAAFCVWSLVALWRKGR